MHAGGLSGPVPRLGRVFAVLKLCDGRVAESDEEAGALASELDDARAGRRIGEAAAHLTANWHPRVGIVGLGSGARLAASAADGARPDALVAWGAEVRVDCPCLCLDAASRAGR